MMCRLLVVAALLLAGCTPVPPTPGPVCPALTPVSPQRQQQLADELKPLPDGAMTLWAITDWIRLRGEIAACREHSL